MTTAGQAQVRRVPRIPLKEVTFVIAGEQEDVETEVRWLSHHHEVHELVWTEQGILRVSAGQRLWSLTPGTAVWIPAGSTHHATATAGTAYHAYFFAPSASWSMPAEPTGVEISGLVRELLTFLGGNGAEIDRNRDRAEALVLDLLRPSPKAAGLPQPVDPRTRTVAEAIVADPTSQTDLATWAALGGLSTRTIGRAFLSSTGLTFGQWRTTVRMHHAIALLADGLPVSEVAQAVGYQTSSAFIAAFRRHAGHTPRTRA